VQNGAIVSVDSLGGKELDWYFRFINEGVEELSPSRRVFITQIGLEPVLLRAADGLGARIEYSSEAVSVEQDADGVTAVVRPRDGGTERTVRARYLVAADGRHSPIRERLGIRQLGHGSFSDSITNLLQGRRSPADGDRISAWCTCSGLGSRVLPLLDRSAGGLPRRQLDRRRRRDAVGPDRGGHEHS
jgi:2-polyprenyl-6-methoxyphenol hydroxylase-like FAD-dependent oxidoreductase